NPSPAYVRRVQDVFVNNGHGVRGDLGAVIRAILLDPEAREAGAFLLSDAFGKVKEPVIRTMSLARIERLGATEADFVWWDYGDYYNETAQDPLNSPSVFNFYRPDYLLAGA